MSPEELKEITYNSYTLESRIVTIDSFLRSAARLGETELIIDDNVVHNAGPDEKVHPLNLGGVSEELYYHYAKCGFDIEITKVRFRKNTGTLALVYEYRHEMKVTW